MNWPEKIPKEWLFEKNHQNHQNLETFKKEYLGEFETVIPSFLPHSTGIVIYFTDKHKYSYFHNDKLLRIVQDPKKGPGYQQTEVDGFKDIMTFLKRSIGPELTTKFERMIFDKFL